MVNLNRLAKTISLALLATFISITGQGNQESAFASTSPDLLVFNDQVCDLASAGYLGDGSVDHPYQISDSDALWEITDCSVTNSSETRFELLNDIDVSQAVYAPTASPIGFSTSDTVYSFSGVLDGKGFTIGGIDMVSRTSGVGLFALLYDASFKQLRLEGNFDSSDNSNPFPTTGGLSMISYGTLNLEFVVSAASVTGDEYVGGLVGRAESSTVITSSWNVGPVSGSQYVGGLIGYQNSPITLHNSGNSGLVTGNDETGGLLGFALSRLQISHSSNSGKVVGTDYVGGLVGRALTFAYIDHSQNSATISGTSDYVGGLIGQSEGDAYVTSSSNTGPISGDSDVGGLFGNTNEVPDESGSAIASSVNSGEVSGREGVGGLVGRANAEISIQRSTNSAEIIGQSDNIGGFVGHAHAKTTVSDSLNEGNVSGGHLDVGGLIGWAEEGLDLVDSANTATIMGNNEVGGLVGGSYGQATVSGATNTGRVRGSDEVGGVFGYAYVATLDRSENSGPVRGLQDVAGLVGGAVNVNISYSFNIGEILGQDDVAGLVADVDSVSVYRSFNSGIIQASMVDVGRLESSGGLIGIADEIEIRESFNSGEVSAMEAAGGFIGSSNQDADIYDSYNVGSTTVGTGGSADGLIGVASDSSLVSLSGVYTSVASTLTETTPATSMKSSGMYSGWNFDSVWGFGTCSENLGYPLLRFANQVATYFPTACYSATVTAPSAGVAVVPPKLPRFDVSLISGNPGQKLVIAGTDLDLVISGTVDSKPVSFSLISETSVEMTLPNLVSGKFSLELTTVNGRVIYQDLIEIVETETVISQLQSLVLVGLNPKSSWLSKTHISQVKSALATKASVVCIAYNDRPGVTSRKKALSRALHACSAAKELGIETRVFVYGKASAKSSTLKVLFR